MASPEAVRQIKPGRQAGGQIASKERELLKGDRARHGEKPKHTRARGWSDGGPGLTWEDYTKWRRLGGVPSHLA